MLILFSRGLVASLGITETFNAIGPALLEGGELFFRCISDCTSSQRAELDTVYDIAIQILEEKALCLQDPDQDEPLEEQVE